MVSDGRDIVCVVFGLRSARCQIPNFWPVFEGSDLGSNRS